jgi:hypothetical protein
VKKNGGKIEILPKIRKAAKRTRANLGSTFPVLKDEKERKGMVQQ